MPRDLRWSRTYSVRLQVAVDERFASAILAVSSAAENRQLWTLCVGSRLEFQTTTWLEEPALMSRCGVRIRYWMLALLVAAAQPAAQPVE